jgi:hypothetical protein
LRQAARLVERRHEEDISTRHEPVLQPIGEIELHADPVGRRRGQLHESLFVAMLAAPEKHELRVAGEQIVSAQDEVEALLGHETAGHAEERRLPTLRQAERALEGGLAAALSLEVVGGILRGDLSVRGRVPLALVDTVEHADEAVGQPGEVIVQAEPASRRAELVRLGGAHGGHEVGEDQAALEEVHLPVPLELPPVVDLPR